MFTQIAEKTMRQMWIAGWVVVVLGAASLMHAQELQLRATTGEQVHESADATGAHGAEEAAYDFTHPALSANSEWAALFSVLVLVFFALAAIIGVLTDIDRAYAPAEDSHDGHASHGHDSHVVAHGHH